MHMVPPLVGAAEHVAQAPMQSMVPAGQLPHWPPVQLAPVGQAVAHAPQLLALVIVLTHTPEQLSGSAELVQAPTHVAPMHMVPPLVGAAEHVAQAPMQSMVPAGQLPHWPPVQLAPVGQAVAHAPQLLALVIVLTHTPEQLSGSAELVQAPTHVAPMHMVPPLVGAAEHVAQAPMQSMVPAGQLPHWPPVQLAPVGQAVAHAPQLLALVIVLTHTPEQLSGSAELVQAPTHVAPMQMVPPLVGAAPHVTHAFMQSMVPAGQLPHRPPVQLAPVGQAVPHAPQLFGLVISFTHTPLQLFGRAELVQAPTHAAPMHMLPPLVGAAAHVTQEFMQSMVPAGQLPHWPPVQLAPVGQAVPHPPQLLGSLVSFTQTPLQLFGSAVFPQVPMHAPALHAFEPLVGGVAQVTHAPPHSIVPEGQLPHVPPAQLSPFAHALPHVPQLFASV